MTPFMAKSGLGIYRIFRKNYRTFHKITGMNLKFVKSVYFAKHTVLGLISNFERQKTVYYRPDRILYVSKLSDHMICISKISNSV